MAEPFLGEIRAFSFNFAPQNWTICAGQLLPISQYSALYSLLGTTFGGDGRINFGLPDLRGRAIVHTNENYPQGAKYGAEYVTVTRSDIPVHAHGMKCSGVAADTGSPANSFLAPATGTDKRYHESGEITAMHEESIAYSGGSAPHANMQPFLVINYCIALQGMYPSRP